MVFISMGFTMNKHQFKITKYNQGKNVSTSYFENDFYFVKITNIDNISATSFNVTPKNNNLQLRILGCEVLIADLELQMITPECATNLAKRLLTAAESAKELKKIIRNYKKEE